MTHPAMHALLGAALSACIPAQDNPFPPGKPEDHGFSPSKLDALVHAMHGCVENGEAVGAEILLVADRHTVLHEVAGWRDRAHEIRMQRGASFRLGAMARPFVGTAMQMLSEREELSLGDRVSDYLPSFDNDSQRDITIRYLMQHPDELEHAESVLAAILAAASKMPVEDFLESRLLQPLRLHDTFCNRAAQEPRQRLDNEPQIPSGEGFGMYSTAADYARLLTLWLDGGVYEGDMVLLSADTVRTALTPTDSAESSGEWRYGQCWQIWSFAPSGSESAPLSAFGHGSRDGALALAFPALDLIVCCFTPAASATTRRKMVQLVLDALEPAKPRRG